eukprot:sb/3467945/
MPDQTHISTTDGVISPIQQIQSKLEQLENARLQNEPGFSIDNKPSTVFELARNISKTKLTKAELVRNLERISTQKPAPITVITTEGATEDKIPGVSSEAWRKVASSRNDNGSYATPLTPAILDPAGGDQMSISHCRTFFCPESIQAAATLYWRVAVDPTCSGAGQGMSLRAWSSIDVENVHSVLNSQDKRRVQTSSVGDLSYLFTTLQTLQTMRKRQPRLMGSLYHQQSTKYPATFDESQPSGSKKTVPVFKKNNPIRGYVGVRQAGGHKQDESRFMK